MELKTKLEELTNIRTKAIRDKEHKFSKLNLTKSVETVVSDAPRALELRYKTYLLHKRKWESEKSATKPLGLTETFNGMRNDINQFSEKLNGAFEKYGIQKVLTICINLYYSMHTIYMFVSFSY